MVHIAIVRGLASTSMLASSMSVRRIRRRIPKTVLAIDWSPSRMTAVAGPSRSKDQHEGDEASIHGSATAPSALMKTASPPATRVLRAIRTASRGRKLNDISLAILRGASPIAVPLR